MMQNTETQTTGVEMIAVNNKTVVDPKGAKPICEECGYTPFDWDFHLACHNFLKHHDQEQYESADASYRARMIAIESV